MFGNVAEMYREIVTEIGVELTHAPMRLIAEWVQFAVLLAIIWVVAFGFRQRKGFVANMLAERRERVAARVEGASGAEQSLSDAKQEAAATVRAGRAKAREIVAQAKKECSELERASQRETDADCSRVEERAASALSTERQEMQLELREQLVDLVSSATRSIMNEKLTVAEQRARIENTIGDSVNASANGGPDARARTRAREAIPKGA